MTMRRFLRAAVTLLIGAALMLGPQAAPAAQAAGPQLSGGGELRSAGASAAFTIELDDLHPLAFSYWDYRTDPARIITFTAPPTVDCLGELFGGQAVRIDGPGSDSAMPGETVTLHLFLVDGAGSEPDRVSLKVVRSDETVVYFAPLRQLDNGSLSISCAP